MFETGCQLHPCDPWTLNRPVAVLVPLIEAEAGFKLRVQLPPDCVKVNDCPLMVIVAVRIPAPGFALAA